MHDDKIHLPIVGGSIGPLHSDELLARMEYRKVLCGDYVCVYKLIDETVFIYRIVHGTTDY